MEALNNLSIIFNSADKQLGKSPNTMKNSYICTAAFLVVDEQQQLYNNS